MKTILLFILLGLLGAGGWLSQILLYLLRGQAFVFNYIDFLIQKGLRPLRYLLDKEIRNRRNKKPDKKPVAVPVSRETPGSIVGGTKTVFIDELPGRKEPEPLETIELPLEEPEPPEIMDSPDAGDFDTETDAAGEDELRREMEDALSAEEHEDSLGDDYLGGVTIKDIESAYNTIHDGDTPQAADEDTVARVLYSLNGTDMFKFIINTEESDQKAKSIMDRYIKRHIADNPPPAGEKKEFKIGDFVE